MTDFILRVYIKFKTFVWNLRILYKIYNFGRYLYEDRIFHNGNSEDVLKMLSKFTELAWSEYPDKIVMNRTPEQSATLLGILINRYYKTGSSTILEQILEVLKNEFIRRGN